MTVAEHQERLSAASESLDEYIGQWVVLRRGKVIASDIDPGRLLAQLQLKDEDVVLLVSDQREGIYLL